MSSFVYLKLFGISCKLLFHGKLYLNDLWLAKKTVASRFEMNQKTETSDGL